MLYQPTNIVPSLDGAVGNGVVDALEDLVISWQVNGNSPMTAFRIYLYHNDAASSLILDTGKRTTGCPFYGTDLYGDPVFFSYTISAAYLAFAGVVNGMDLKLILRCWWSAAEYVTLSSAAAFVTRARPTLSLTALPDPVTGRSQTFSVTYAQAEGDAMNRLRWRLAEADRTEAPFLDTLGAYGAIQPELSWDGFRAGVRYAVRCDIQTENGVDADTGWTEFDVRYAQAAAPGSVTAAREAETGGLRLTWPASASIAGETVLGYAVFRREGDGPETRLCVVDPPTGDTGTLCDCAAPEESCVYRVYPVGASAFLTRAMESPAVFCPGRAWILLAAEETDRDVFWVRESFRFALNAVSGTLDNRSSPGLADSFLPWPTVMASPANALSGTLRALLGAVTESGGVRQYVGGRALRDRVRALSVTERTLFLRTPMGDLMRVRTAGPVRFLPADGVPGGPVTVELPWVECGSVEGIGVVAP